MRASWIAIAVVALGVGIVAGYRLAHVDRRPVESAEHNGVPSAPDTHAKTAGSEGSATGTQEAPVKSEDTRSSPQSEGNLPVERTQADKPRSTKSWESVPLSPALATPPPAEAAQQAPTAAAHPLPARGAPGRPAPQVAPLVPGAVPPTPARNETTPAPTDKDAKTGSTEDPDSDRVPPVLQGLRFDPPEIKDGGDSTLTIMATDNLSGVRSIVGTIRSPSDAANLSFSAQDTGGGAFTARIVIPRQAETGDWYLGTLQIVDKASNPVNATYSKASVPPGGSLRVVSADSDSTAPTVHRVSVEKPSVSGGERNQVVIEVDDDRSGVASVTGAFQSASRAAFIPFGATASSETTWTAIVSVPAGAECGEWTLRQLRVVDKANNSAVLMANAPELGHVTFMVAGGGECDAEPPILDGIYASPTVISNSSASDVMLTFNAHDTGSGLSTVTGRVEGPVAVGGQVPRIFFTVRVDPNNPDAPLVTKINIPQFAASGVWRVVYVELTDKARNVRGYNASEPVLANGFVTVE
jgi:hypothetical protein